MPNKHMQGLTLKINDVYGSGHRKMYNWGWTGKNNKTFMSNGNTYFNRFNKPNVFEHLFDIFSVCFLQFRLVSKVNPRKLNSSTLSIYTSSILSVRACIRLLGIWKTIYFVTVTDNKS